MVRDCVRGHNANTVIPSPYTGKSEDAEEDAPNIEDDSINLMLEDEDKMLEDEMQFNDYKVRIIQIRDFPFGFGKVAA